MIYLQLLFKAVGQKLQCKLGYHQWDYWRNHRMCSIAGCQKFQILSRNGRWITFND